MVFDEKFSTAEHTKEVAVPGNCKNLVEEHSELATQENFSNTKMVAYQKILKNSLTYGVLTR